MSSRRLALWICVALLTGLLLELARRRVLRDPTAASPRTAEPAFTDRAQGLEPAAPDALRGDRRAVVDAASAPALVERADDAADLLNGAARAVEPPVPDGVEVLVVRAQDETPVPAAIVDWLDWDALRGRERESAAAFVHDLDRAMLVAGRHFRTDANGIARVPRPLIGAELVARGDGCYGIGRASSGARARAIVRMGRDVAIEARVRTHDGRAFARATLALRASDELNDEDLARVTTDDEGRARFEHVHAYRERAQGKRLALALVMLADEPVAIALDAADLERGIDTPLELTAPPSGRVIVRVRSAPSTPAHVALALDASASERATAQGSRARRATYVPVQSLVRPEDSGDESGDAVAVFDHVGLDLALVATLHAAGGVSVQARANGPRRSADANGAPVELVIDARMASPAQRIVGRALTNDGQPLASRALVARWNVRTGLVLDRTEARAMTDERGAFEIALSTPLAPESVAKLTLLDGVRGAHVALPAPDARGVIDAGDLALDELPLVCAGRVVDAHGAGVADARLELFAVHHAGDCSSTVPLLEFDCVTRAAGGFEVRGNCDARGLGVSATTRDSATRELVEFAPGTRDLDVIVSPRAWLSGRVLLPERARSSDVRISIESDAALATVNPCALQLDGAFTGTLEPGRSVLCVHVGGELEPALRFELDVDRGGPLRDPRFEPLDLRTHAWVSCLRIEDEQRRLVENATLLRIDEHGQPLTTGAPAKIEATGSYRFVSSMRGPNVLVLADGLRSQRIDALEQDRTIVLERGRRVALHIRGIPADSLAADVWTVQTRRSSSVGVPPWFKCEHVPLLTDTVELELDCARYQVRVFAGPRARASERGVLRNDASSWRVPLRGLAAIDVQDSAELQRFTFDVDAKGFEPVRASLDRSR